MSNISRSRGALIRKHKSGIRVVMYQDSPGEYFDEQGHPADKQLARQAGFDVEALEKLRVKLERKRQYEQKLELEFEGEEQRLARLASGEGGFEIRALGQKGSYGIFDEQGNQITKQPLELTEAKVVYRSLAGQDYVSEGDNPPELDEDVKGPDPVKPRPEKWEDLTTAELKQFLAGKEIDTTGARAKRDLVPIAKEHFPEGPGGVRPGTAEAGVDPKDPGAGVDAGNAQHDDGSLPQGDSSLV